MAKIFIFRHGQTTDNLIHEFSGWRDVDLDENGILEAKEIGEKLKDQPATKAYYSDLLRSKHTLELVLGRYHQNVEVFEDSRIKERDYGTLTSLDKDMIEELDPKDYELWHRSYNVAPPNGESIEMVEKRVLDFLNEVIPTWEKDDVIFISAHGNSIRPMRRFFEHLSIDQMCAYEYAPGEIFEYKI
jgi:2,3-bisphosphoglycerate-dependent phosphoglycerate mutase